MGHAEDVAALDALTAWDDPRFRAGLGVLRGSTAAAARRYATEMRVLAALAARVPRCPDDQRGGTPWTSFLREVALARSTSDRAAASDVHAAQRLTTCLTRTLDLLSRGELAVARARAFLAELHAVDDDLAALVEQDLLDQLPRLSPSRIEQQVRKSLARLDADAAALRAAAARARRDVTLQPLPDEQASVQITGPAVPLTRWYATLDRRARALRQAGDPRTLAQLRFDLAVADRPCVTHVPIDTATAVVPDAHPGVGDADPGDAARAAVGLRPAAVEPAPADCRLARPVQAHIVVPVETPLGLSNEPGWLDGYGWISAPTVRTLLVDAELRRVCAKRDTGELVDLADRDLRPPPSPTGLREALLAMLFDDDGAIAMTDTAWRTEAEHDPTPLLRQFVTLRDRTCDGPTMTSTPASRCELDHDTAWPDGPTAAWNLVARSTRTHQLKHAGWTPVRTAQGTVWFSPAGQMVLTPHHLSPSPGIDDPDHATLPDPDELAQTDLALITPPGRHDLPPWSAVDDPPPF